MKKLTTEGAASTEAEGRKKAQKAQNWRPKYARTLGILLAEDYSMRRGEWTVKARALGQCLDAIVEFSDAACISRKSAVTRMFYRLARAEGVRIEVHRELCAPATGNPS